MSITGNAASREAILGSLRNSLRVLAKELPRAAEPLVPEVWLVGTPTPDEMAQTFIESLTAVAGEPVRVPDTAAAAKEVEKLLKETKSNGCCAVQKPLANDVFSQLPKNRQISWQSDWEPSEMAKLPMSIVEAEYLLADTGTSVVISGNPQLRMACYLPPVCVIVATLDRLREHMPAAWKDIMQEASNPNVRGEFAFITGPSRTADIEQQLILGVHGPKRLRVILIG
ncbi:MAG: lactate utilization protein [Thermoguttaceae bacterium]|nr:lactate utilization protein [Thermoguttaceae bacterium]